MRKAAKRSPHLVVRDPVIEETEHRKGGGNETRVARMSQRGHKSTTGTSIVHRFWGKSLSVCPEAGRWKEEGNYLWKQKIRRE